MTCQYRTVRVFLSSTFRDFAEERDLLVRKIFPELRRKCRARQVELVDVDLRWGITEEEAQQGRVLPICLAEIDRSRPFFMGFIGERYGWVPEAEKYDLSLIMEQSWLDEHRGGKSVTELEMLYGVLNNPAMEDRAFFYFRDSAYSQAKGGAYLSEGPQEKAKLEALKDRIRQSGFPVVENYRSPEELAERVRDDLWKLIDEAFPESEVPDALARERMRHEAFTASRLGLYIGGEHYFSQIDSAMLAETRKPVLVTGDSGGGKSALLANWASRFSQNDPSAILLTHCLATGADAAQPVNMAVRILREISRIIGEELVLEGDPRKALHMLSPWLAKAGAFATQKGGFFVLVLDGLDKMDAQHDMGWWPSMLPEGVGLVASCLSGKILDAIASRMDWENLPVSPLQREDCETFIASHLGKYRKSLTPEFTSKILAHPLSGNPLFLRTLLEELRVFGVHEELGPKLDHYLTSQTVDDLFERVLERVETDNSPESVRAVLEVLWAAKESFAEDELLAVSGLPPAVWAPIHIALDESLIGAGGRLAFSHDHLRKAVEDRYLPSAEDSRRIQNRMSEFCAQAMAGGRKDISHYVRRHAVEHFLEVEDWDNATAALSDLEFIESRAIAQELPAMLKDYAELVKLLPEGEKERQMEAARQAELDRYAREMYEYSSTWSRIREGSGEPEPTLPRLVKSVRLWSEEEIAAERKRMTETPSRLDIVRAFRVFVATNSAPLQKYSAQEGFAANLARNDAPAGPVHEDGKRQLDPLKSIKLIKQFAHEEGYNPLPACTAILEGHSKCINSISICENSRFAISGSSDKTLRVWNLESGECLNVLEGHSGRVISTSISPDGCLAVSGDDDFTLRLWCLKSGKCLKVFAGHTGFINSIALSADVRFALSGSSDKTLRLWNLESGECLKVLDGHTDSIRTIAFSNDSRLAISASEDKTLRTWDLKSGLCVEILNHDCSHSFDFLQNLFNAVRASNLCSATKQNDNQGPTRHQYISADGRRAVSATGNYTPCVWDLESGECVKVLRGHTGWTVSIAISADGRRAVSGSLDNTLRIWNLETGDNPHARDVHTDRVKAVVLGTDRHLAVSGSLDNTLRVWDLKTLECLKVLNGHVDCITTLNLSADNRYIVSTCQKNVLRIWDCDSGKCLKVIAVQRALCMALSKCGRFTIAGGFKNLRVWDLQTGKCLKILEGHTQPIRSIAVDSENRFAVSGSSDNTLRIWNLETGRCLKVLEGHSGKILCVKFSADGRQIVSTGEDNVLRVWDSKSGECIKVLEGFRGLVSLSEDSRLAFLGSEEDNTLCILNLQSGECLARFFIRGLASISINSPDFKLVAGLSSGQVEFYNLGNLPLGPFITTSDREILSEGLHAGPVTYNGELNYYVK